MEYETQVDSPKISKFNSAALINSRIDELWRNTHKFCNSGEYSRWNITLDRVWMELVGDTSKEEEEQFKKLNDNISKYSHFFHKLPVGFERITEIQLKRNKIIYDAIMEKEKFIRKLVNKQGKGTAYEDEDDDWE